MADVTTRCSHRNVSDRPTSRASQGKGGNYDIYASLPRSLKQEVMVRSKVKEQDDEIMKRQALVQAKTPTELGQINSFSEIPVPRKIEDWLHHNQHEHEHK